MTDYTTARKAQGQLIVLQSLSEQLQQVSQARLIIQTAHPDMSLPHPPSILLSLPFTIDTAFSLWFPFDLLWGWVFQKAVVQAVIGNKVLHTLYFCRGFRVGRRSGSSSICISKGSCKTQGSPQARQKFAFYRSTLPRACSAHRQQRRNRTSATQQGKRKGMNRILKPVQNLA